jgi:tripartite-type tricarboxylate transporter receptor subunit TctC
MAERERSPHLPNVPTAAEAGLPGHEVSQFYALMAPARTPPAILARLDRDVRQVVQSDSYRKRLDAQGATPGDGGAQELAAFLKREIEQNRSTAQAAGITAEQ